MPTWERTAQDAAEAEHPPPEVPQDEPAFQRPPLKSAAGVFVFVALLLFGLLALTFVLLTLSLAFGTGDLSL